MRKGLLSLVFLTLAMLMIPTAIQTSALFPQYPYPAPGNPEFYPLYISNDAGFAYNLSGVTFVTTLLNLTGLFEYNYSEGGLQVVTYYIALGQLVSNSQYGAYYIQPTINFADNGSLWVLAWNVQAWGNNSGTPYEEYNNGGLIAGGIGSATNLNYLFNLTIKATLNSQGQITSAWVYIANAKTGQVYFSQTINLPYPIPDTQVFFEVEDPLNSTKPVNFPVIPSNNYLFVKALATNSTLCDIGLPFSSGVAFNMQPPAATAYVWPTLPSLGTNNLNAPQGVEYFW